jgi:hypothetical protein
LALCDCCWLRACCEVEVLTPTNCRGANPAHQPAPRINTNVITSYKYLVHTCVGGGCLSALLACMHLPVPVYSLCTQWRLVWTATPGNQGSYLQPARLVLVCGHACMCMPQPWHIIAAQ